MFNVTNVPLLYLLLSPPTALPHTHTSHHPPTQPSLLRMTHETVASFVSKVQAPTVVILWVLIAPAKIDRTASVSDYRGMIHRVVVSVTPFWREWNFFVALVLFGILRNSFTSLPITSCALHWSLAPLMFVMHAPCPVLHGQTASILVKVVWLCETTLYLSQQWVEHLQAYSLVGIQSSAAWDRWP